MRGDAGRKRKRSKDRETANLMRMEQGTLWIRVPAELDHHSADEICRKADGIVKTEDIREIVFDFSGTVFCDSSGIGMLMGRYKLMAALGGRVRAVQVGGRVGRILLLSGVTGIIPVEEKQGGDQDEK